MQQTALYSSVLCVFVHVGADAAKRPVAACYLLGPPEYSMVSVP